MFTSCLFKVVDTRLEFQRNTPTIFTCEYVPNVFFDIFPTSESLVAIYCRYNLSASKLHGLDLSLFQLHRHPFNCLYTYIYIYVTLICNEIQVLGTCHCPLYSNRLTVFLCNHLFCYFFCCFVLLQRLMMW
jgi:hypothetical protein